MNIEIRLASMTDLDVIEPLVCAYHEFEHLETSRSRREKSLRVLLADNSLGGVWLIHVENEIVGYIALCIGYSIEFGGFDAFVDEFYIEPPHRGKGIGKKVLELIKKKAQELNINTLHLEVARSNDGARNLYAGAGFETREKYVLMSFAVAPGKKSSR